MLNLALGFPELFVHASSCVFNRVSQIAEENFNNLLKKRASPPLGSPLKLKELATSRDAL